MRGYCLLHAKKMLDAETWASCKLGHCKVPGCTSKVLLRQYCEEHGRIMLGDERFDTLLSVHKCKAIDCDSRPVKAGYCAAHENLRFQTQLDSKQVVATEPKGKGECKEPGCQKKRSIQGMCHVHAKLNLDPATYQSLYRAIKGCREPGCERVHVIRYFCTNHARKNLEPHVFEKLTRGFKFCKYSDCKNKVGKKGRDGFCEVHIPSAADVGSMDTSNGDQPPNENETKEEEEEEKGGVAHGEEAREYRAFITGKYAQLKGEYEKLNGEYEKLNGEHAQIQRENERLRLLLQK